MSVTVGIFRELVDRAREQEAQAAERRLTCAHGRPGRRLKGCCGGEKQLWICEHPNVVAAFGEGHEFPVRHCRPERCRYWRDADEVERESSTGSAGATR